jgi:hypothetical protein
VNTRSPKIPPNNAESLEVLCLPDELPKAAFAGGYFFVLNRRSANKLEQEGQPMKHIFLLNGFIICAVFLFPAAVMLTKAPVPTVAQPDNAPKVLSATAPHDHQCVFSQDRRGQGNAKLEEYLIGVVSAEMPASFEPEALKAQAVAARSYAVRKNGAGPPSRTQGRVGGAPTAPTATPIFQRKTRLPTGGASRRGKLQQAFCGGERHGKVR